MIVRRYHLRILRSSLNMNANDVAFQNRWIGALQQCNVTTTGLYKSNDPPAYRIYHDGQLQIVYPKIRTMPEKEQKKMDLGCIDHPPSGCKPDVLPLN